MEKCLDGVCVCLDDVDRFLFESGLSIFIGQQSHNNKKKKEKGEKREWNIQKKRDHVHEDMYATNNFQTLLRFSENIHTIIFSNMNSVIDVISSNKIHSFN